MLTTDTVTVIVGSNARQCDAEPMPDALGAAQKAAPKRSRPPVSSLAAVTADAQGPGRARARGCADMAPRGERQLLRGEYAGQAH